MGIKQCLIKFGEKLMVCTQNELGQIKADLGEGVEGDNIDIHLVKNKRSVVQHRL